VKIRIPCSVKICNRPLALSALLFATVATGISSAHSDDKWVGTWASAQQGTNVAFGGVTPVFTNQTLRQIVRVSIGGSTLRVRLSNVIGAEPLTISAASVAKRNSGASIHESSLRPLTFSGAESVTIPDGAYILSDPVALTVNAFDDLAVSLYLSEETAVPTQHNAALQTNYVSTAGNYAGATELSVESMNQSWYLLSGVDVLAPSGTTVIATFGDSITDGTNSTSDANSRYPDLLAQRIAAQSETASVLNLGIAGNRVLHSLIGPNALARFDRDVIGRPGVTHVILLEGINDIGLPGLIGLTTQEVTAEQIIGGYQQLIERAHTHGISIIGSTLTPYKTSLYYTEEGDAKRMAVNDWVRSSGAFDGYVDFDLALQDPENPLQFLPMFDSGDNLHPSDIGYQAMADTIDLALLGFSAGGNVSASRYDARQGEIFWPRTEANRFNIYRDQILLTPTSIDATSFYQKTLERDVSYVYEVVTVDAFGNETGSLGTVTLPSQAGSVD